MNRLTSLIILLIILLTVQTAHAADLTAAQDLITPAGLPQLGKWMLKADNSPANWLNQKNRGKMLREPINIIIIDPAAESAAEAEKDLIESCRQAGYKIRWGHSSGYHGYIAGAAYAQLPKEKDKAFSDGPFEIDNNHGRIFGPCFYQGKYYFAGAFSREIIVLNKNPIHQYGSFNRARDDFAARMDEKTKFKIKAFVTLDNAVIDNPILTTGDHDGIAVLLVGD